MNVKICGITNAADAKAALLAGADFLGFIFYPPSPRAITPEQFLELKAEIFLDPDVALLMTKPNRPLLVGVFVNEPAETTAALLDNCGLDLAQLSGDESPEQVVSRRSPLYGRAYKAIRPASLDEAIEAAERYIPEHLTSDNLRHPHLLLDTPHGKLYGGSGQQGNWDIGAALAAQYPGLMLAGGLSPGNIREAIERVQPFAVDVASGVERSPGLKDHALLHSLIQQAKTA